MRFSNDPAHTDYVTASNRGLFLFWVYIGERSALGVKGFFLVQLLNPWPSQLQCKGGQWVRWKIRKVKRRIEIEKTDVAHCPSGWPIMLFEDEFVADADDPRLSWRFCLSPIFPPFRKIIKIAIRKFKISKSSFLLVFFFFISLHDDRSRNQKKGLEPSLRV